MTYINSVRNQIAKTYNIAWQRKFTEGDESLDFGKIKIYVDGSYSTKTFEAGWGFVVVKNNKKIAFGHGKISDKKFGSRNITGECYAVIKAVEWLKKEGINKAIVVHDYLGLGKWGIGEWKRNSEIAKTYYKSVDNSQAHLHFKWVRGHQDNMWNEEADRMAELGKSQTVIKYINYKGK